MFLIHKILKKSMNKPPSNIKIGKESEQFTQRNIQMAYKYMKNV